MALDLGGTNLCVSPLKDMGFLSNTILKAEFAKLFSTATKPSPCVNKSTALPRPSRQEKRLHSSVRIMNSCTTHGKPAHHEFALILLDYLADSVDAFLSTEATVDYGSLTEAGGNTSNTIHLGLTFSFPVEQTALDSGKILTWTKGFAARNAIGNDVVKLLQDAFDRKHMSVKCIALVNDVGSAIINTMRD